MQNDSRIAFLLARLGVGLIFLVSGIGKVTGWSGTVAYAAKKGVPVSLLAIATALELVGAILLLAGWKTRWGVAALLLFLVPATVVFHGFWGYQGADLQQQTIQFLKNLSIGGGLLAIYGAGPGAFSIDGRYDHPIRATAQETTP
jgi:putative oxidoreductase